MRTYMHKLNLLKDNLAMNKEKYRSLVESTEDSIYLVDRAYRYLFMNGQHRTRMGFSGNEFLEQPYRHFHSPEESKEFEVHIDEVFRTGLSRKRKHHSARDGKRFLRTFSPVRDREDRIIAVSVISKDISEFSHIS